MGEPKSGDSGYGAQSRPRGRPRGFEEERALEAVMMLFWRRGYAGASLDDLAAASGASRASLYQLFGDKRAMLVRSLDLYAERFLERVEAALAANATAAAALRAVLDASADRLCSAEGPPGCLRCRVTLELKGTDPVTDAAILAANRTYLAGMRRIVEAALARGEIAPPAGDLALVFTAVVGGLVTLAEGGADRRALAVVIERTLALWPYRRERGEAAPDWA